MPPWNVLVLVQVFYDLPDYRQIQKYVKVLIGYVILELRIINLEGRE
jgi:hypothetical protein